MRKVLKGNVRLNKNGCTKMRGEYIKRVTGIAYTEACSPP